MFSRCLWIISPTLRIGAKSDLFTHTSHRFTKRLAQPELRYFQTSLRLSFMAQALATFRFAAFKGPVTKSV